MLTALLRFIRHTSRPTGSDAGMSLVELMVAMAVAMVVGLAALTMFAVVNRSTNAVVAGNVSSSSARTTLDSWAALVQSTTLPRSGVDTANAFSNPTVGQETVGQAIASFTPTNLTFYSARGNRDNASAADPATLIRLEWVAAGSVTKCPDTEAVRPGCLIESVLNPGATPSPAGTPNGSPTPVPAPPAASSRVLLTGVEPGAEVDPGTALPSPGTFAGACAGGTAIVANRLFTACAATGAPLSAACAGVTCTQEDPTVLTTTNISVGGVDPADLQVPTSVVIAFRTVNRDNDGTVHTQAYLSAAALTGQVVRD